MESPRKVFSPDTKDITLSSIYIYVFRGAGESFVKTLQKCSPTHCCGPVNGLPDVKGKTADV